MSSKSSGKPQSSVGLGKDEGHTLEILSLVKSLHKYSKNTWTSHEEALWKKYLEMLRDEELGVLKSRGRDREKAEMLVEWVWVRRDPESRVIVVEHVPPSDSSSFVPAIRVFRNGSFKIHHRIKSYLDSHPLLAIPKGEAVVAGDDRPYVLQALDEMNGIDEERDFGKDYIGLNYGAGPAIPEDGGKYRRLADCVTAAQELKGLLDLGYRRDETGENFKWLQEWRGWEQFWRLLDAAFLFGESIERHRILDGMGAEEAMLRRITTPPGKGNRINRSVVRMIEAYMLENALLPTAGKLLKWLGGKKPHDVRKPLQVNHPLWTTDMKLITWGQFQDHVKKSKQKMKESESTHP